MTNFKSILIAVALVLNDSKLIGHDSIYEYKHLGAACVYLISVAAILSQVPLIPWFIFPKSSPFCVFFEVPIALVILEWSLRYVWKHIQDFITSSSDILLSQLVDTPSMEGLVCYLCCSKGDCPALFCDILLRMVSFACLTVACLFWQIE